MKLNKNLTFSFIVLMFLLFALVAFFLHTQLYAGNAVTLLEAMFNETNISNVFYYSIWTLFYFTFIGIISIRRNK